MATLTKLLLTHVWLPANNTVADIDYRPRKGGPVVTALFFAVDSLLYSEVDGVGDDAKAAGGAVSSAVQRWVPINQLAALYSLDTNTNASLRLRKELKKAYDLPGNTLPGHYPSGPTLARLVLPGDELGPSGQAQWYVFSIWLFKGVCTHMCCTLLGLPRGQVLRSQPLSVSTKVRGNAATRFGKMLRRGSHALLSTQSRV